MKKRAVYWLITLVVLAGLVAALWPKPAEAAPSRWRFQSIWAPSITLWKGDKYWVDLMNVMGTGDVEVGLDSQAPLRGLPSNAHVTALGSLTNGPTRARRTITGGIR